MQLTEFTLKMHEKKRLFSSRIELTSREGEISSEQSEVEHFEDIFEGRG